MAVLRTLAGPLSVTLILACAAPALAHSTSSGVGNGGHPVSASTVDGGASESGASSEGSAASSEGSGASSEGSANSSAASGGTSEGTSNGLEISAGTSESSAASSNSESSASSEQQDPQPEDPPADESNDTADVIIASTVLGTITAATVGSVLLTIFAVNELSAELYLRSNGHALRHHIERGAGNALQDLAHLCGVPTSEYARFAEATRKARRTLIVHLEDPRSIGAEQTRAFLRELAEAMGEDHELARALIAQAYPS